VNGYPARVGYFQTPWHIVLLLVIALLLFGGKRLPEIGKALGSGMREFKDAVTGNSPSSSEPQPELPAAEPTATPTTATPPERETV
jgi:sec-independent protein translocase protein TatA